MVQEIENCLEIDIHSHDDTVIYCHEFDPECHVCQFTAGDVETLLSNVLGSEENSSPKHRMPQEAMNISHYGNGHCVTPVVSTRGFSNFISSTATENSYAPGDVGDTATTRTAAIPQCHYSTPFPVVFNNATTFDNVQPVLGPSHISSERQSHGHPSVTQYTDIFVMEPTQTFQHDARAFMKYIINQWELLKPRFEMLVLGIGCTCPIKRDVMNEKFHASGIQSLQ